MKESLEKDFWRKFSFSGNIVCSETWLCEDMLMVEYPCGLTLDVGFYNGIFKVYVIKDSDWLSPVAEYVCKNAEDLEKIIKLAVGYAEAVL